LNLNIIPTNINRTDVSKILRTIWDALLFLEKENMQQCYVSKKRVWFEGEIIKLDALVNKVESRVNSKLLS